MPRAKETTSLNVTAQDVAQRVALAKKAQGTAAGSEEPWRFESFADGVAYLRMPSWALYNSKWDWKGFLDRGMDELIASRAGLIVDLRDNEGGIDVGNVLIERIAPPNTRRELRRFTRYRTLPVGLAQYLQTWDTSFKDWGDKAIPGRAAFSS